MKGKTLKDWFLEREVQHPELGAYINLCYVVHHSGATRKDIAKAFNELIPKDEYDKGEKTELIDYLFCKASEVNDNQKTLKKIGDKGQVLYSVVSYKQ